MPRPLFEVPGWSVPTEPTSSSPSKKSRKRKRPHDDDASEKLGSAQVNLEKLMGALDRAGPVKRPPKKKHKGKKSTDSSEEITDNKPTAATSPKVYPNKPKDVRKPSKKPKGVHKTPKEKGVSKPHHSPKVADSEDPSLTTLQNRMKKKLDGGRFR
jgi:ribosomal RNA-processing protein 8